MPFLNDLVKKLPSTAHLSDHVDIALILVCLVQLDDVGMIQFHQDLNLIQELWPVLHLSLGDSFDGSPGILTGLPFQSPLHHCPEGPSP